MLIGDSPRPWILVIHPSDGSIPEDLFGDLGGRVRAIPHNAIGTVNQADYDAVMVFGAAPDLARHLYVIQFEGSPAVHRSRMLGNLPNVSRVAKVPGAHSARFLIEDGARDIDAEKLMAESLPEPASGYAVLHAVGSKNVMEPSVYRSFATEPSGNSLSGRFIRWDDDAAEWWYLPGSAARHARDWVQKAITVWQSLDPVRFPSPPDWRGMSEWQSVEEWSIARRLASHQARQERVQRALESRRTSITAELEAAAHQADAHARLLLTAQGDALVFEVIAALEDLGLEVADSDALPANHQAKREDLQVRDGTWVALAEVKGYEKRMASTRDLQQVSRAVEVFARRTETWPDARWYIINQAFGLRPGAQPVPLGSSREDVEMFAEVGGLVIDTRDLFRLRNAVLEGELQKSDARALLKGTRVFTYPAGV